MDSNAPNAMIARLKEPPRPPNAVIAKGRNRGKLQMLLSPRKNALDSLFKEVRAFKEIANKQNYEQTGVFDIIRKILVSVKFLSAILGPEMGAPILWTPGKMRSFCRKNNVRKISLFWGGVLGGGGESADFIFMGARIFLI